ncbi:hypothetical protein AJ79_03428 [Helicocarpus griseus UAMH5409]|uniref:FAD dependent oxidoreductase domain-containing protein n=1 Tax=Helicocarpus griseus UAMH5409 TaxID=1447875 RepID=A0A2B7XXV6_9EURO|nr:hypothetical protein AJ79_03428 [Helicocarpus griseus UAMH5409]
MDSPQKLKIGIIGAGWYGCHIALELRKLGHEIEMFEKNHEIFQGISGSFGIRLHKGPHYPRSRVTREICRDAYPKLCQLYPDLVVPNERAIYAHGKEDALGNPSKVTEQDFHDVCYESAECESLNPEKLGFRNVNSAYNLDEANIVVGERLRQAFVDRLRQASVKVRLNSDVQEIVSLNTTTLVKVHGSNYKFDVIVNATAYESLIPAQLSKLLPSQIDTTYQSAIGVIYEDLTRRENLTSFIVMDGWYPCIMPMISSHNTHRREYLVIHGCYTILGSFDDYENAKRHLDQLNDSIMDAKIRPQIDRELERFWPGYHRRFAYRGWKGGVIAKLKTTGEFRSSLTFEKDGVVYIFPGKINTVITAAEETITLINNLIRRRYDIPTTGQDDDVEVFNGVSYTAHGPLSIASQEIENKPVPGELHTSNLQTFAKLG